MLINAKFKQNQTVYPVFHLKSSTKSLATELHVDEIKIGQDGEVYYRDNRYKNSFGWVPEYTLFATYEDASQEATVRNQLVKI